MENYKFTLSFQGWSPAFETFPIETAEGILIGAFTVAEASQWNCFIARTGYPESLVVADGKCYATPEYAEDGSINKLIVSFAKLNEESIHFTPREDAHGG